MEKEIKIPTTDDKNLYGVLRSVKDSKGLIIMVHGLTGHKNESQFYSAARSFEKGGFDSFRFDLYGGEEDERDLIDCTITTHSIDVDTVVDFFRKDYDKLFLIGHSLGAPSIIYGKQKVDAITLWDPSFRMYDTSSDYWSFNEKLDCYLMSWGPSFLSNKEMLHQWQNFNEDEYVNMISKPTKFIFAGEGTLKTLWKPYLEKIPVAFEEVIIEGANHCFQEDGNFEILFAQTLSWFEKF